MDFGGVSFCFRLFGACACRKRGRAQRRPNEPEANRGSTEHQTNFQNRDWGWSKFNFTGNLRTHSERVAFLLYFSLICQKRTCVGYFCFPFQLWGIKRTAGLLSFKTVSFIAQSWRIYSILFSYIIFGNFFKYIQFIIFKKNLNK